MSSPGVFARVAGREMSEFDGKGVLLLGKVESLNDGSATVSSADGSTMTVQLAGETNITLTVGTYYQFKGKATGPTTMTEYTHTTAGDGSVEIDMASYMKLCELWNGKHAGTFKP
jgi:hypothetical protein